MIFFTQNGWKIQAVIFRIFTWLLIEIFRERLECYLMVEIKKSSLGGVSLQVSIPKLPFEMGLSPPLGYANTRGGSGILKGLLAVEVSTRSLSFRENKHICQANVVG